LFVINLTIKCLARLELIKTNIMLDDLRQQYAMVQKPRAILFDFLQDVVGNEGLNRVFPEFDNKSIRGLLEHTAGCYFAWISFHALGRPRGLFKHEPCNTIDLVRQLFASVDGTMDDFLGSFQDRMDVPVRSEHDPGEWITATPLMLFTHVMTHEFHHKGQVVWLGRLMGYTPADTDASNCFSWVKATEADLR
jgi:uncharacterized damage-inducible protein DinB